MDWDGVAPIQPPQDVIRWSGATPVQVREHRAMLQQALRPGGRLEIHGARRPRRIAKLLRPYFEGGVPSAKERFRPVRAKGDVVLAYRRGPGLEADHFDALASHYDDELPAHVAAHYLSRKVAQLLQAGAAGRGLEVGCGQGHMAAAVQAAGAEMVALDRSPRSAQRAAAKGLDAWAADAQSLPFGDASFDFAYAVNMVHHLKRGEQDQALAELLRVVRPGAPVVIFEINVRNPLFRFYMRQVFPRTRAIDRGDEEFLDPREFPLPAGARVDDVVYSTFLPDFVPRALLGPARRLEQVLERSPAAPWSIHMAVILRAPAAS